MQKTVKILTIACILLGFFLALNYIQHASADKQAYISITFDDGYSSQYHAAAVLENYDFKGTFYIPSALVEGEFEGKQLMNWSQITDLQAKGHEIGGHTATHLKASSVSKDECELDVIEGKKILEEHGISAESFAYPYGDDSYKIAGSTFVTARTTKPCINKLSAKELCGLTLVHQINEYKILSVYLADLKLRGGWLVIVIHDISDNPRPDVDITNEEFEWILNQIKNSGIPVKTIAEVVNETA